MTFRKVPWTSQPQVPVGIDWSNPITRGLRLVYVPTGLEPTRAGAGPSKTPNLGGLGWTGFTEANYLNITMPTGMTAGTLMTVTQNTAITNADSLWVVNADTGNNDFIPYTNSLIYMGAWATDRYLSAQAIPAGVTLTKPYVAIAVGSNVATTHALYLNNKQVGSTTNATFKYSPIMKLGSYGSAAGQYLHGRMYLVSIWDRILSASERQSISDNPWQIFQPINTPIFVGLGGGAASASIDSTEATDVASIDATASGTTSASVDTTETTDTASITAANWATAQLSSNETTDTTSVSALATTGAGIAAVETTDIASITGDANLGAISASISTADTADSTAITTSWTTGAAIYGTDGADSAIIAAENWVTAQASMADSPDVADITAVNLGVLNASIATVDFSDTTSLLAEATVGAEIVFSDTPDIVSILGGTAVFTPEQLLYLEANYVSLTDIPLIAAAVLAAMNAAPPKVNTVLINSTQLAGSGVPADPMRAA